MKRAWPTGGWSPFPWDHDACALAPLARPRPGVLKWEDLLVGVFKCWTAMGAERANLPIWISHVRDGQGFWGCGLLRWGRRCASGVLGKIIFSPGGPSCGAVRGGTPRSGRHLSPLCGGKTQRRRS